MAALRNFNGLASWGNAENSLQSVNLTMPHGVHPPAFHLKKDRRLQVAEFYSARSWEIPPLPWTNLSPPFSPWIDLDAPATAPPGPHRLSRASLLERLHEATGDRVASFARTGSTGLFLLPLPRLARPQVPRPPAPAVPRPPAHRVRPLPLPLRIRRTPRRRGPPAKQSTKKRSEPI